MLTDRARKYLATLKREPFVPTKQVERIFIDSECPFFENWLEFHEKYAGYVEVLGNDTATWGLVHREPGWLAPMGIEVDYDKKEDGYDIVCADVHPSYNYVLTNRGEFLGFPSESFDIYVERKSIGREFSLDGKVIDFNKGGVDEEKVSRVLRDSNFIPEASDKFSSYYLYENILLIKSSNYSSIRGWVKE